MPVSAYYVTLETRQPFEIGEYTEAAGSLVNALQGTLGDTEKFRAITKASELIDPRVEVEVMQSEPAPSATIVARAIVQAESELAFDKTTFTKMLRGKLPFAVSISKRSEA